MKKFVYLAGPILGCTRLEANGWRKIVAEKLSEVGITGISPLRCEPLSGETYQAHYDCPMFGHARAIAAKNFYDVKTCDLMLAYMPEPKIIREELANGLSIIENVGHHSYGTLIELGWAQMLGKPIVLVSGDESLHQHPVVASAAGWLLKDLRDGVDVAIGILGGYCDGGKNV